MLAYVIFFCNFAADFVRTRMHIQRNAHIIKGKLTKKKRIIMANEKQQGGLMFNALTAGSKIVGNITADSDFRIDGMIEGDLNCTGKVVIGEAGRIKGTVICQHAEILGLMEGKINCSQQLSLRASGKIQGDVHTKTLVVEPGALFNGTCSMGAEKAAAPAK